MPYYSDITLTIGNRFRSLGWQRQVTSFSIRVHFLDRSRLSRRVTNDADGSFMSVGLSVMVKEV